VTIAPEAKTPDPRAPQERSTRSAGRRYRRSAAIPPECFWTPVGVGVREIGGEEARERAGIGLPPWPRTVDLRSRGLGGSTRYRLGLRTDPAGVKTTPAAVSNIVRRISLLRWQSMRLRCAVAPENTRPRPKGQGGRPDGDPPPTRGCSRGANPSAAIRHRWAIVRSPKTTPVVTNIRFHGMASCVGGGW